VVKLYLPYGTLRSFKGHSHVTLHWFIKDRKEPVVPYAQLIQSYRQLSLEEQHRAQRVVDELFTGDEFLAFRRYLYDQYKEDLRTEVLVPPVLAGKQNTSKSRGLIRPFEDCFESEGGGFCKLSEQAGYSLPFVVWGYYTDPSKSLFPRPINAVA
jgi:hypothetical protein